MVLVAAGPLLQRPASHPPEQGSLIVSAGGAEFVVPDRQFPSCRMDVVRRRFEGEGFSSEVVDLWVVRWPQHETTRIPLTLRPGEFGQIVV